MTGLWSSPATSRARIAQYWDRCQSLKEIVAANNPTRLIVGMFERRNRLPVADLLELRFAGTIIEEASYAYERVCGRVPIKELRPSQLIYSGELGPRRQTMRGKPFQPPRGGHRCYRGSRPSCCSPPWR